MVCAPVITGLDWMVWSVANFFVTSRQLVGSVGRVEFGERTTRQADKVAADRRSTNHVSAWKLRHCLRKKTWLLRVHVYKF